MLKNVPRALHEIDSDLSNLPYQLRTAEAAADELASIDDALEAELSKVFKAVQLGLQCRTKTGEVMSGRQLQTYEMRLKDCREALDPAPLRPMPRPGGGTRITPRLDLSERLLSLINQFSPVRRSLRELEELMRLSDSVEGLIAKEERLQEERELRVAGPGERQPFVLLSGNFGQSIDGLFSITPTGGIVYLDGFQAISNQERICPATAADLAAAEELLA